jgi:hypothetical protein
MSGRGVYSLPARDRAQLARGVEHLCRLGERAVAELLLEIASDRELLLDRLAAYGRLSPDVLRDLDAHTWTAPLRHMRRAA